ncbi:hypothetical protein SAMN04490243_2600 [Robiginitalea myxolifaciens]|uniref:Xaa-Pro dipeptidyl-peptidase-like domain-containing protein n=1 Tax=Robiginitalea myxolifaciens TaxID=400055 RepID=A0A1I6HDF1_9FLAO|nr:alpha/beta hydrolase [Robiginitalea myxolifaciens]SFR52516.1 hypothetical protein SAMN04490243_2600 [Robiginitalea myxolifaciens]
MKRIGLLVLLFLCRGNLLAQDIQGTWNGLLEIQGMSLRLVLNVAPGEDGYVSTLDSPDQGTKGILVDRTLFENDILHFEVERLKLSYSGNLSSDGVIRGTFSQMGSSFPLNLQREAIEKVVKNRPQEPELPLPYYTEELRFPNNTAGIELAGTLSLPDTTGVYPAVVLISGSGPQNRDEELLGHKPFLVLSDYLVRQGIGVLRFDDRGTAQSTGDFASATSRDFAADVASAIEYLTQRREIDSNQIGLIGHSEGGLIAPMVAASNPETAFIIMLAGPGVSGYDIILEQTRLINDADGVDPLVSAKNREVLKGTLNALMVNEDLEIARSEATSFLQSTLENDTLLLPEGMPNEEFINNQLNVLITPWMRYFLIYDPAESLRKVTCPVLAINGEKDLQVPPGQNLPAIEMYLKEAGNTRFQIAELPNLNHLFQESTTGSPTEYAEIEQTFSPAAMDLISDWILAQVN